MCAACDRQVRLAVSRNQDFRMNNGRAEVEVEYDIGFDRDGRVRALEMQVCCSASHAWHMETGTLEPRVLMCFPDAGLHTRGSMLVSLVRH